MRWDPGKHSIGCSMRTIVIYFAQGVHRSMLVAQAMAAGARAARVPVSLRASVTYRGRPDHDVAIFYGLADGLRRVFDDYRRDRRAIYIDLGYWGRRKRTRWDGYHKLVLNSRHPTAYFQSRAHPPDRFRSFGVDIRPWRRPEANGHIIVAGMSAKAAAVEGFGAEEWERETIAKLGQLTKRRIIYRPKPNWLGASAIRGSVWLGRDVPLESALKGCHAVVAHHSNVAVDALLAGIPCICPGGAASVLSGHELEHIEDPPMPDGREQWAADLAYTQWSLEEMQTGAAFRYLLAEGLI